MQADNKHEQTNAAATTELVCSRISLMFAIGRSLNSKTTACLPTSSQLMPSKHSNIQIVIIVIVIMLTDFILFVRSIPISANAIAWPLQSLPGKGVLFSSQLEHTKRHLFTCLPSLLNANSFLFRYRSQPPPSPAPLPVTSR